MIYKYFPRLCLMVRRLTCGVPEYVPWTDFDNRAITALTILIISAVCVILIAIAQQLPF
jgi:hypothetical protein